MGERLAEIDIADRWRPEDFAVVAQGLLVYNEPFLGPSDYRRLAVTARTDREVVGAILGETGRGMAHFDLVWVSPAMRGQGLGSRLVAAALDEAHKRGCRGAWLDTYDFQARAFYERHGFTMFAELPGFANDHSRIFMVKHF